MLSVFCAALLLLAPQQPVERPRPVGTATVTGVVLDGASETRLAGAVVTLNGAGFGSGEKVTSDGDGAFTPEIQFPCPTADAFCTNGGVS